MPEHSLPLNLDDVPVFGCIVYIRKLPDGGVCGRVANLPDLELVGSNEREVLSKLVPVFKQTVIEARDRTGDFGLLSSPKPIRDDEVRRFLPVHL